jgi:putative flippase GtrA
MLQNKSARFLIAGGVMGLGGLALNLLLVEVMQMTRQPAYGIVMVFLIFLGFVLNRYFTFDKGDTGLTALFFQYVSVVFLFRLTDWFIYALLVEILGVYYPIAQVASGIIIMALKYLSYKKLFEDGLFS